MGAAPIVLSDERLEEIVRLVAAVAHIPQFPVVVNAADLLIVLRLACVGKGIDPFPEEAQ